MATDLGPTAFEDAKWVYLALAHAHTPVDVLSEQQLAEGELTRYKVAYIIGPNLRRDAAAQVLSWVRAGGTLWTDCLGLSRDEANQPAVALIDMLGPDQREAEKWGSVEGYRAAGLKPLAEVRAPAYATLSWDAGENGGKRTAPARIGREVLAQEGADVLARFGDGKPAVVRRRYGQGEVVQAGVWAGLTYSADVRRADFDLGKHFDPALREFIAQPAIARNVACPVVPSNALVEAILLDRDGRRSVALVNWGFRHGDNQGERRAPKLTSVEQLVVTLPDGVAKSVRSLKHGELRVTHEAGKTVVNLPRLDEIDLLVLE